MAPDMEAEDMEEKDRDAFAEALLEELKAGAEQEQLTATYKGALCKEPFKGPYIGARCY